MIKVRIDRLSVHRQPRHSASYRIYGGHHILWRNKVEDVSSQGSLYRPNAFLCIGSLEGMEVEGRHCFARKCHFKEDLSAFHK